MILTEPKNALVKQYQKLFDMDGIRLEFTEDALDYLVDKAMEYKLGARGLRSLCEAVLTDAMYELPGSDIAELTVDELYAKNAIDRNLSTQLEAVSA